MSETRWLLLLHQLPPKPAYLRVKIWRRLHALGAIAIKNSVYALPMDPRARERFRRVLREIVAGGGEGSICGASFVHGLRDADIEAAFIDARDADYTALREEAQAIAKSLGRAKNLRRARIEAANKRVARLRKRFSEVTAIDFFQARTRVNVSELLDSLEARLRDSEEGVRT